VQFMPGSQVGDSKRSADSVMLVGAALLMLGPPKIRQHVVIRPAGVAELTPQIEILTLAANIDETVDRARSTEHPAARPRQPAAGQLALRLGLKLPSDLRVVDVAIETGGDMDPWIAVLAAGFQHQDAGAPVGGEAVRQHASGGAGAYDDEVEFSRVSH